MKDKTAYLIIILGETIMVTAECFKIVPIIILGAIICNIPIWVKAFKR